MSNQSQLKVVIDTGMFDPKIGASNDVLDICRIASKLFKTDFYFSSQSAKSDCINLLKYATYIPLKSIPFDKKRPFQYLKNVLQWVIFLRKEHIDVVHINYYSWGHSSIFAAYLLRLNIVSRAGLNATVNNPSLKLIKHYVANCKEQAQSLISSVHRNKVHIVGDLVDVGRLKNAKKLELPFFDNSKKLKILYVGQLSERKGIHILIEAIANLLEKPDVALVGGDWDANGYPLAMKKMIDDNNLNDAIKLVNHRNDIPSIMKESDILVLPSLAEARPRIILEAMFLGKCVIASSVGGIPDMICDGETGLLVQPNDPLMLSKTLQKLQNNKATVQMLGAAAAEFAQKDLLPEHTVSKYIEIYRS